MTNNDPSNIRNNNYRTKQPSKIAFTALLIGMFLGLIIGGVVFINLDNPKGPNPYGWWYPATFLSAVLGGLLGVLLHYNYNKNKE